MSKKEKVLKRDEKGFVTNKHFWSIERGNQLIKLSKFTGEARVKGPGLHFCMPMFTVGKEVNITDRNNHFVDIRCKSKDDYEVFLDIDLVTCFTDVLKAEFAASNPGEILTSTLEGMFRKFTSTKDYQELSEMKFDINAPENSWMKDILDDFENNYGLKISKVIFKKVRLPKELEDDFQKKIIQEKENERRLSEAKTTVEVAKYNAKAKEVDKQVDTTVIDKQIEKLLKHGFTLEQIKEIVNTRQIKESNGNVTYIVGNNNGVAQMAAAMSAMQNNQNTEQVQEETKTYVKK